MATRHAQFEKVLNDLLREILGEGVYAEIDGADDRNNTWRVAIGKPVECYDRTIVKADVAFVSGNFAKAYTDAVNWVWRQQYEWAMRMYQRMLKMHTSLADEYDKLRNEHKEVEKAYDNLRTKFDNVMSTMNVDYDDMFPDDRFTKDVDDDA